MSVKGFFDEDGRPTEEYLQQLRVLAPLMGSKSTLVGCWIKSIDRRARLAHFVVEITHQGRTVWVKCSNRFAVSAIAEADADATKCKRCLAEAKALGASVS